MKSLALAVGMLLAVTATGQIGVDEYDVLLKNLDRAKDHVEAMTESGDVHRNLSLACSFYRVASDRVSEWSRGFAGDPGAPARFRPDAVDVELHVPIRRVAVTLTAIRTLCDETWDAVLSSRAGAASRRGWDLEQALNELGAALAALGAQ